MGLDLTFCIIPENRDWWLGYDRLGTERDYALYSQISEIGRGGSRPVMRPRPVPPEADFMWYGDEGLQEKLEDPYGEPLTYVLALDFHKINLERVNDRNRPVIEFIKMLPPQTRIVLYWH